MTAMLRPTVPLVLLTALVVALPACDSANTEGQRLFEQEALLTVPSGVTRTDATGAALATDADDWRIGPGFATRVIGVDPLFPNPVRASQTATLPVNTNGTRGGLVLVVLEADGRFRTLDERPDATQPGLPTLSFFGSQLGPVAGLYRVVLLDGAGGVVSYGDVQLNP